MKTVSDLSEWLNGAAEQLGDASKAVCQTFFQWRRIPGIFPELICFDFDGLVMLEWGDGPLPLPLRSGAPALDHEGQIVEYGMTEITRGVWSMFPSLYIEGQLHAFIVLYDVPDPAPWDRRIILTGR